MRINIQTSGIWIVSLLYALWLSSMTYVFYLEQGLADVALEIALIAGGIPVAAQMIHGKAELRKIARPVMFTGAFLIIIILSFITNITDYNIFIKLFNIFFVFSVAIIIGSCPDHRIILYTSSFYAVLGSAILVLVNFEGNFVWGRLSSGGIGPNAWGLVAASVGVTAFALRGRLLAATCWIIVLVTLYNTSSRGSMVALLAGCIVVAAAWFAETRQKKFVLSLTAILLCLFGLLSVLELIPQAYFSFVYDDVLRLNDPYRGLGTGGSGRQEAWIETLEIWMSNPVFGVGFRQHEEFVKSGSSAHNAYLTMLADTGLFGLIAYVLLIFVSLREAWRRQMPIRVRLVLLAVIVSYATLGLFERRALNAGNAYSILFVICCYYSLRTGADKRSHTVDQRLRNELKDTADPRLSG
jgi:O-antigen ligase